MIQLLLDPSSRYMANENEIAITKEIPVMFLFIAALFTVSKIWKHKCL